MINLYSCSLHSIYISTWKLARHFVGACDVRVSLDFVV